MVLLSQSLIVLTNLPIPTKRLIVQLITALLQRISETVIALFTPGVDSYAFLLPSSATAFMKPSPLFF